MSLREATRSKPSYEELKTKFTKQRSKTKEMKNILNDYAHKMREMQERIEAQEMETREKERQQVTARDRMREEFESLVDNLKDSARLLNGKVMRLEQENKELNSYVTLVSAREIPHTTRTQYLENPGTAHSFTVSRQINTTATTSRI